MAVVRRDHLLFAPQVHNQGLATSISIPVKPMGQKGAVQGALYKVLTLSSSNWTLIKVVKFMRQLVPHEPQLGKKLIVPLSRIIETSGAKSLQFECLYTIASAAKLALGIWARGYAITELIAKTPNTKWFRRQA
uniref:Adaptor protein complex 3 subunit delta n=1 Tax=Gephyrocapsa oceanica TaxID=38817 RepID=A0A0M3SAN8_9EUKA|nr:adaptor protein complex 3 subunit delta [Gephyrocapsa oceanica]